MGRNISKLKKRRLVEEKSVGHPVAVTSRVLSQNTLFLLNFVQKPKIDLLSKIGKAEKYTEVERVET